MFTALVNDWLHFEERGRQFRVHTEVVTSSVLRKDLSDRLAREDDVPRIVRQLTLRRTAVFENADGVAPRVRVSPHLRRFHTAPDEPDDA